MRRTSGVTAAIQARFSRSCCGHQCARYTGAASASAATRSARNPGTHCGGPCAEMSAQFSSSAKRLLTMVMSLLCSRSRSDQSRA